MVWEGFCREEHLHVLTAWYQLGGLQQPPTLTELAGLDATLVKDLQYFLRKLGEVRKRYDSTHHAGQSR